MSGPDLFAAPGAADPPPPAWDGVSFKRAEASHPEFEIIKLLYELPVDGMPAGFKCLLKVPRAKIAAVLAAGGHPPLWRHGELMRIKRGDDGQNAMP